jgi:hypothetical protein
VFAYQEGVRAELARQNPEMIQGKFRLVIMFWRQQLEYKTIQSQKARNQEADGTNLYKSTEDALAGILFPNDRDNIDGQFFVVEQGVDVEPLVVIGIEAVKRDAVAGYAKSLMDGATYAKAFGGDHDLRSEIMATNSTIDPDSEYGDAPEVF